MPYNGSSNYGRQKQAVPAHYGGVAETMPLAARRSFECLLYSLSGIDSVTVYDSIISIRRWYTSADRFTTLHQTSCHHCLPCFQSRAEGSLLHSHRSPSSKHATLGSSTRLITTTSHVRMKRKRHHAVHSSKTPIDLTLSDEDERVNGCGFVKNDEPVVLSEDEHEDGDEVLFVKNKLAPSPPVSSRKSVSQGKAGLSTSKSINDVLKDKQSNASTIPKSLPPLLLSTPLSVSTHTPCSLHYDILPLKLAEKLYKKMLLESKTWTKNKWYLNDKLVESNHKTCFYHSKIDGRFDDQWYMGRKLNDNLDNGGNVQGRTYLDEMEEVRLIIEEFVNEQLKNKKRFDLEYDGKWKANVAASNCYRGGAETVGYHADQLTYLGPYPTIASLSLGTTRIFRLRAVQSLQDNSATPPPRTYDIELPHNSLCIMGAGCQEKFKHTIPPARSIDVFKCKNGDTVETYIERINITFRFYRPDFLPADTPICHCNVPCVLKADAKGKAAMNITKNQPHDPQQDEGKKCSYFKLLDMNGEKRGPCIGDHL